MVAHDANSRILCWLWCSHMRMHGILSASMQVYESQAAPVVIATGACEHFCEMQLKFLQWAKFGSVWPSLLLLLSSCWTLYCYRELNAFVVKSLSSALKPARGQNMPMLACAVKYGIALRRETGAPSLSLPLQQCTLNSFIRSGMCGMDPHAHISKDSTASAFCVHVSMAACRLH